MDNQNLSQIVDFNDKRIQLFVDSIRPPVELRSKIDIEYAYSNYVLEIFESHPKWDNPDKWEKYPRAKAKYNKANKVWKIYWMRANGKWEPYTPTPELIDLSDFFKLLKEDVHGCFWG